MTGERRRTHGTRIVLALGFVGFGAASVLAQLSLADRAAVDGYRAAIISAASGASWRGIEVAFADLTSMRESLMRPQAGQNTVLESLPDEEFRRLQRELPGALINREEVVFVEPDPGYFLKLAATRGDRADRAFFAAFKATYPTSVWPVYLQQQTDYSGCTRFGNKSLVGTYRIWSDFLRKFPGRYVDGATRESDGVLEQLTESTCACGNKASVVKELSRFLRTFPQSPARAKIDGRLKALRSGRSDIRTGCVGG